MINFPLSTLIQFELFLASAPHQPATPSPDGGLVGFQLEAFSMLGMTLPFDKPIGAEVEQPECELSSYCLSNNYIKP